MRSPRGRKTGVALDHAVLHLNGAGAALKVRQAGNGPRKRSCGYENGSILGVKPEDGSWRRNATCSDESGAQPHDGAAVPSSSEVTASTRTVPQEHTQRARFRPR